MGGEAVLKHRARVGRYQQTVAGRFMHGKSKARQKGIEWHLTREQYAALVAHPCAYCKGPLNPKGSGLDRMDSNGSYEEGNVLPCCGECNRIKSDKFSVDEMKRIGVLIAAIRAERENLS